MRNEYRGRLVLLMSVLILVSASFFAIAEGGGPQSPGASQETSKAVALSDGFILSTTGCGTASEYTIAVTVPDNGGEPYKNYTVSFTGTFTVPADPSYGTFTASADADSGSGSGDGVAIIDSGIQTVRYTAKDDADRAQIGADLSSITYNGAGTVTVTVTDEGASSLQVTQTYAEESIDDDVCVSTIGDGPEHYSNLSNAYTNASGMNQLSVSNTKIDSVYVSSAGVDNNTDGSKTKPCKTLGRAYSLVKDGGTIYLMSDITADRCTEVKSNITITSDSGAKHTITRTSDIELIHIESGSVTLKNVTLTDSTGSSGSRTKALVMVAVNNQSTTVVDVFATLNLAEGSTVKDIGMANNASEWGVIVVCSGGKLMMQNGAEIKDCKAASGPVRCFAGRFEMSGGTISGCSSYYANEGAAVYLSQNSTMTMSGGTITGCGGSEDNGAGAVYLHESGGSTFEMSGGRITGNTAQYGGGVYSDIKSSTNTIKVSGNAYISGNTNSSGGESNIYLASGQYVVISGEMSNEAKVGVYTASEITDKVKIAGFASGVTPSQEYAGYFYSDKPGIAGVLFEDDALFLSIEAGTGYVKFGSLPEGMELIEGSLDQKTTGSKGTPEAITQIVLASGSDYADVVEKQVEAINQELSGKGLSAALTDRTITINGTPMASVNIDLATILSGDLAPKKAQAMLKDSDSSVIGKYATVSEALNVAASTQTIDVIKPDTGLILVEDGTLKEGVTLKISSESYEADGGNATIDMDKDGNVTLSNGKLQVADGDVSVRVGDSTISVETDSLMTVEINDGKPKVGIPSENKATIDGMEYEAAAENTEILISGSKNVLMSGAVKIGKDKEIFVVEGKVPVKNLIDGDDKRILVTIGDAGSGSISIPAGGKAEIGGKEISAGSNNGITVDIGGTGDLSVTMGDGEEVVVGGAGYKAAGTSAKILIGGDANTLESGAVRVGQDGSIAVKDGPTVINGGSADVTVSIGDGGSAVKMSNGGKATIDGMEYDAAAENTEILISGSKNVLMSGAVKIGKDKEIFVVEGKVPVKNLIDGDDKMILVTIGDGGTGNISIPAGGNAKIGTTEYEATSSDSEIQVGESNVLVKGAVKFGQNGSIAVKDGPTVTNKDTGDVTVSIEEDGSIVDISNGGKATIDGMEYEAAAENTEILISESKNVLMSGAVKIGKDKEIFVVEGKVPVKNLIDGDDKMILVTIGDGGTGNISIPAGGKAEIGAVAIEGIGAQVTAEVGKDRKISVAIDAGQTVRIGDSTYTGDSSHGSKISIDPDTGTVTVLDMRKIEFDTGMGPSFDMECGKGETIALPTGRESGHVIEREGYVLVGWRSADSQSSTKDYGLGFDYTVGEDETLKAIWVENEDVVVYRTDDGGSIEGSTYAVPDDGIASLDSTVVKDGYVFLGWKTDSGDETVAYAFGLTVEASGTTYMTAYLVPESSLSGLCTVRYDSGYSASITSKQYVEPDVFVSLPTARDMHRDGYTFLGWEVAGTSTVALAVTLGAEAGEMVSGKYFVTEDVTLTAVWAAEGSDDQPWWDDDDDPYFPYHPDTGGSSKGYTDTILIVVVASVAVLLLQLMILSSRRRS